MSSREGARNGRCAARYRSAMEKMTARLFVVRGSWFVVGSAFVMAVPSRRRTENPPLTTYHQPKSGRPENDALIEAAHAVATRIDRHPRIAKRLDNGNDARADVGLECLRQLVRANLDAGEIV